MSNQIREKNWSTSELGEINTWPRSLLSTLNFILSSSSPMLLFWKRDTYFFFYNDAWLNDFGIDRENKKMPGLPAGEVFEELWEQLEPAVNQVFSGGSNVLPPETQSLIALWNLAFAPVIGESGKTEGVIASINVNKFGSNNYNLTWQPSNLQERVNQYNSILDHTSEAIFVTTPQGIISGWNKASEKLFGYPATDIVGKHIANLIPQSLTTQIAALAERLITTDQIGGLSTQFIGKDTIPINVDLSLRAMRNSSGKLSSIVHYVNRDGAVDHDPQGSSESREQLPFIMEASGLGTWELDLRDRRIKYSQRYLEIHGYNEYREIPHNELLMQLHPEDVRKYESAMETALTSGHMNVEVRVFWKDRTLHWVETRAQVFRDSQNKPVKLAGTVRDVTEQRLREQELYESEQKFRILADSVPQLIWTSDVNGNLGYFNLSFFEYTGLTPKHIYNDGWIQIVHPEDRKESVQLWARSIEEGEPFLIEHRFRRYDGQYRWHLSRAQPQRDHKGMIQMWVGTSTEIHDQKTFSAELENRVAQRTSQLNEAIDDLKKSNQELEQFAYVSSHDLQEPLRKIQTFSGILNNKLGAVDSESRLYLEKIHSSAQRMSQLIKDLLEYSRLSRSGTKLEDTDLNEILERVKNDFEVLIQRKKAIIISTKLPVVKAIPVQMNQLFYNLIGNALKFCDKKPFIEVTAKPASAQDIRDLAGINPGARYYHLMFKDNGIGFEQEHANQIFTIFQRLNEMKKYAGTGIGLAICKKITENHKGIINAVSEPGKGSVFNVFIPI